MDSHKRPHACNACLRAIVFLGPPPIAFQAKSFKTLGLNVTSHNPTIHDNFSKWLIYIQFITFHIHPSSTMFKDWRSFRHFFLWENPPTTKSFPISPKGKKTTRKKHVAWNPPNCHAHHLQHTWLPRTLGLIFQAFPRVGGVGSLGSFSTCKVGQQDWAPIVISIGGYNSTTKGGYKL